MDKQAHDPGNTHQTTVQTSVTERPVYEVPSVTVMDEAEVLKAFQFTSAAATWWTM